MKGVEVREIGSTKNKRIFHVYVGPRDTKFVAKELFSKGTAKLYPFYVNDQGKAQPKYQNIRFVGTRNKKYPKTGFSVNENRGYGFTNSQGVSRFFRYIDRSSPAVKGIIFVEGKTKLSEKGILELSFKDFWKIQRQAKLFSNAKASEEDSLIRNTLNDILPDTYKAAGKYIYGPGSLARFIDKYAESPFSLSDNDAESLKQIITTSGLSTDLVISTKKEIDKVYIEDVVEEFKQLFAYKMGTKSLEDKWHVFFKKHTWIFSQIFAFPAVFIRDKFNVGGQDLSGGTDKIVDFIYKNKLTNNITFIEIKTHKTKLVNNAVYRKPDIYSVSRDLSGSIVQVLDQENQFLKNYHSKKGVSGIESLNSGCLVIIGDLGALKSKQKRDSFELFRSSNKDVHIVTFDEVLEKMTTLLDIFTKS